MMHTARGCAGTRSRLVQTLDLASSTIRSRSYQALRVTLSRPGPPRLAISNAAIQYTGGESHRQAEAPGPHGAHTRRSVVGYLGKRQHPACSRRLAGRQSCASHRGLRVARRPLGGQTVNEMSRSAGCLYGINHGWRTMGAPVARPGRHGPGLQRQYWEPGNGAARFVARPRHHL
jgi:hypothetical protein